jgi:hypothetical protein
VVTKLTCLAAASLLISMSACHKSADRSAVAPSAAVDDADETADRVSLKPEQVAKVGVESVEVKAIKRAAQARGFAVVFAHDTIAQAVAELETASALERQSRLAMARGQRLAGTAGALPADTQETAERQVAVDQAALDLSRRRLSALLGSNPPWNETDAAANLSALASGRNKLVRVTFPLGSLGETDPKTFDLTRIGASAGTPHWETKTVWRAPGDAAVPGRSFFALLKWGDVGEGERLLAFASIGEAQDGVEVPASAVILSGGSYWCFLEEQPGVFVRTALDVSLPTPDGYFVRERISAGGKVVIKGAGQLLAYQVNPAKDAD